MNRSANRDFTLNRPVLNNPLGIALPSTELWVFGYGSLMWNPGFDYLESRLARLYGFSRRLCLWSIHYRGTPEQPGLVVGLVPGGSCYGMAFKIDQSHLPETLDYLHDREMLNRAYRPVVKDVYLDNGGKAPALAFASRLDHSQFAALTSEQQMISIIRTAEGPMGSNVEYIANTVSRLKEMGIYDSQLYRIAGHLENGP